MKSSLFIVAAFASISVLTGCAASGPNSESPLLVEIEDIATGAYQVRPAFVEVNGKLAVLHSTKKDRVALQTGTQTQLLDETARVKQGGSYFQLNKVDQSLNATWWSHQDGKNIYFTSSNDGGQHFGPVGIVNAEHGVLTPYSLVSGPQGALGMIYHDERLPNYQAYFNRSADGGRTWSAQDQRLDTPPAEGRSSDAHEPQIVQCGSAWIGIWTELVNIGGKSNYRVVSRRSEDAGQTWSLPASPHSADYQISALVVRATGNSIVVAADELQRGVIALTSQDGGLTWRNVGVLAGTDGVSNSGIDLTLSPGRAHIVWMQDRANEKTHILRASLDIAQSKWLDVAQRLDVKATENTRSISPVIIATKSGPLVAAWVDYRDIRPNIYLSASYDQGTGWSAPKALAEPGTLSLGWPKLIPFGDQAAIGYEAYPADQERAGKFIVKYLPVGDAATGLKGLQAPAKITEAERRAKLERRVKELWDARIAGDYDKAYDMFDFVYKSITPKSVYLANSGVITYLQWAMDTITVEGNEAAVNVKLKYEMKPTMTPFTPKPISVAPVDVEIPNNWVWVGNDWYLVYKPSFEPQPLKY